MERIFRNPEIYGLCELTLYEIIQIWNYFADFISSLSLDFQGLWKNDYLTP